MAILFYEGLPRSGKSYEAMSTLVIPWLQKGREVVAYIEGLETEECQVRIAEAAGLPLERVKALLFPITREDMRPREVTEKGKKVTIDGTWIEKTRDNALHVYDESQNWWPNRMKASEQLTQFVTEHGHRGITILLMGQSLLDVLALWRRRVDQKFVFLKLTALGRDNNYRVTIQKGQGNGEFVKVTDKLSKYDPKYFGTYKSHTSGEIDTDTYTDNRAVFWKSKGIQYGAMISIGLLVWGGFTLYKFFQPPPAAKPGSASAAKAVPPPAPAARALAAPPTASNPPGDTQVAPDTRTPEERYFSDLAGKGRVRLAGLLVGRGKVTGYVEWVDGNTRVVERLGIDTLQDLGVKVQVVGVAVKLSLGGWNALATMWPMEGEARVSDERQQQIRGQAGAHGGAGQVDARPGLVLIDSARPVPSPPSDGGSGGGGLQQARVKPGSPWSFSQQ
uniref:zonular occludens toxin family protein n=1 Tax=unclassified Variovorax TaxID=663243 RepID=UPI000D3AD252